MQKTVLNCGQSMPVLQIITMKISLSLLQLYDNHQFANLINQPETRGALTCPSCSFQANVLMGWGRM